MSERRRRHEPDHHDSDTEMPDAGPPSKDGAGDKPSPRGHKRRRSLESASRNVKKEQSKSRQGIEVYEMAREMVQAGIPFDQVTGHLAEAIEPHDLSRILEEMELLLDKSKTKGGYSFSPRMFATPEGSDREEYNENEWNGYYPPPPAPSPQGESSTDAPRQSSAKVIPLSEATFARALENSDPGSKPYYRKGDILRIIGHRRRLDEYYEMLPLKPPGEAGRALRKHFEGVEEVAVEEVGREARTEKEKDCFRCAVEWDG